MEFIGKDGWPAPLLKNATIDSIAEDLYLDCVKMMRDLYRKCRLVHAGMVFLKSLVEVLRFLTIFLACLLGQFIIFFYNFN